MVKHMADLPDIVITSMEQTHPHVLMETSATYSGRVVLREVSDEPWAAKGTVEERRVWRFRDREGLHMFAAARVRDYRSEGMSAEAPYSRLYDHCYDIRTKPSAWPRSRCKTIAW